MSWHYDRDETYGNRRLEIEGLLLKDNKMEIDEVLKSAAAGEYDLDSVAAGIQLASSIICDVDLSGESNNISIAMARLYNARKIVSMAAAGEAYDPDRDEAGDEEIRAQWEAEGKPDSDDE